MSILKYGSTTITPTPVVVIDRQRVGNPDGSFQGTRDTWKLSGTIIAATPAAITTAYQALETAFTDGGDLVLYDNDGTTVRHSLTNSQTLQGTKITRPMTYPQGEGAELATIRTWSVEVSGIVLLAGAPSSTAWGQATTTYATDAQGQVHINVSGTYRGPGAAAAAAAQKLANPAYMTESEETRTTPDTDEVSFTYVYKDPTNSRQVVSLVETVSQEPSLSKIVFRYPLGATPVQQTTITGTAKATQSGEAVGVNGFPTPNAGLWSTNLISQRVGFRSPRLTKDGQFTDYVTTWEYTFEFPTTQSTASPGNPPT